MTGAKPSAVRINTRKQPRRFIREHEVPADALRWFSPRQKLRALYKWRISTGKKFAEHARCLRIAWVLEWLFGKEGYAFASDSFLESELGMPVKNVQSGLLSLEKGGAIIRTSCFVNGKVQRRIWPSRANIPLTVGNMDTPHHEPNTHPTVGIQNTEERKRSHKARLSSTAIAARRSAELNEHKRKARDEVLLGHDPEEEAA